MDRLTEHRTGGLDAEALRRWGAVFLTAGLIGRGVIQNHILGIGSVSMNVLLEQMASSDQVMWLVTISLVLQAVETCALPIYALLLTEGFRHTHDRSRYLGRVLALALICELPYNLALGGALWHTDSRNPVFGLVLTMVMLWFYSRYSLPGIKNLAVKLVVTLAAVVWSQMLSIDNGACLVLITAVLWAMRGRPMYRSFAGAAVSVACMAFSPFCLAAPMGFLAVHLYNGEREGSRPWVNYLVYPALLVLTAAAGIFL